MYSWKRHLPDTGDMASSAKRQCTSSVQQNHLSTRFDLTLSMYIRGDFLQDIIKQFAVSLLTVLRSQGLGVHPVTFDFTRGFVNTFLHMQWKKGNIPLFKDSIVPLFHDHSSDVQKGGRFTLTSLQLSQKIGFNSMTQRDTTGSLRGKAPLLPGKGPILPDKASVLSGGPVLPGRTTAQSGKAPIQPGRSSIHPSKATVQPGKNSSRPGKSSLQPGKAPIHPVKSSTQPGKAPVKAGKSLFQPDKAIVEAGKSLFQPDKAIVEAGKSLFQPGKATVQPDKAPFEPGKYLFQPGRSIVQPVITGNPSVSGKALVQLDKAPVLPGKVPVLPSVLSKATNTESCVGCTGDAGLVIEGKDTIIQRCSQSHHHTSRNEQSSQTDSGVVDNCEQGTQTDTDVTDNCEQSTQTDSCFVNPFQQNSGPSVDLKEMSATREMEKMCPPLVQEETRSKRTVERDETQVEKLADMKNKEPTVERPDGDVTVNGHSVEERDRGGKSVQQSDSLIQLRSQVNGSPLVEARTAGGSVQCNGEDSIQRRAPPSQNRVQSVTEHVLNDARSSHNSTPCGDVSRRDIAQHISPGYMTQFHGYPGSGGNLRQPSHPQSNETQSVFTGDRPQQFSEDAKLFVMNPPPHRNDSPSNSAPQAMNSVVPCRSNTVFANIHGQPVQAPYITNLPAHRHVPSWMETQFRPGSGRPQPWNGPQAMRSLSPTASTSISGFHRHAVPGSHPRFTGSVTRTSRHRVGNLIQLTGVPSGVGPVDTRRCASVPPLSFSADQTRCPAWSDKVTTKNVQTGTPTSAQSFSVCTDTAGRPAPRSEINGGHCIQTSSVEIFPPSTVVPLSVSANLVAESAPSDGQHIETGGQITSTLSCVNSNQVSNPILSPSVSVGGVDGGEMEHGKPSVSVSGHDVHNTDNSECQSGVLPSFCVGQTKVSCAVADQEVSQKRCIQSGQLPDNSQQGDLVIVSRLGQYVQSSQTTTPTCYTAGGRSNDVHTTQTGACVEQTDDTDSRQKSHVPMDTTDGKSDLSDKSVSVLMSSQPRRVSARSCKGHIPSLKSIPLPDELLVRTGGQIQSAKQTEVCDQTDIEAQTSAVRPGSVDMMDTDGENTHNNNNGSTPRASEHTSSSNKIQMNNGERQISPGERNSNTYHKETNQGRIKTLVNQIQMIVGQLTGGQTPPRVSTSSSRCQEDKSSSKSRHQDNGVTPKEIVSSTQGEQSSVSASGSQDGSRQETCSVTQKLTALLEKTSQCSSNKKKWGPMKSDGSTGQKDVSSVADCAMNGETSNTVQSSDTTTSAGLTQPAVSETNPECSDRAQFAPCVTVSRSSGRDGRRHQGIQTDRLLTSNRWTMTQKPQRLNRRIMTVQPRTKENCTLTDAIVLHETSTLTDKSYTKDASTLTRCLKPTISSSSQTIMAVAEVETETETAPVCDQTERGTMTDSTQKHKKTVTAMTPSPQIQQPMNGEDKAGNTMATASSPKQTTKHEKKALTSTRSTHEAEHPVKKPRPEVTGCEQEASTSILCGQDLQQVIKTDIGEVNLTSPKTETVEEHYVPAQRESKVCVCKQEGCGVEEGVEDKGTSSRDQDTVRITIKVRIGKGCNIKLAS